MAGRKPKPTELKVLQGTFRKDRHNGKELKPTNELNNPPDHFNDEQKEIWHYAIENAPSGLLKKLDITALETWVTSYYFYREAAIRVTKTGQIIKTQDGQLTVNPYMSNMNKQVVIMLKSASEMGFTPASRSRIVMADEATASDAWSQLANGA